MCITNEPAEKDYTQYLCFCGHDWEAHEPEYKCANCDCYNFDNNFDPE